jgi:2-polyprenyl-3-methyl-5-hydroxy-6-metoxy-1,4-benzoquinol methylase
MFHLKTVFKSIPLVGPPLVHLCELPGFRRRLRDEAWCAITKRDPKKTLYADRYAEVHEYFGLSTAQTIRHYLANGMPHTTHYRRRLIGIFDRLGVGEAELKGVYEQASFMYVNRLMLKYHRFRLGRSILELARDLGLEPGELRVLDYGCGVGDTSLFLASHGASVTLVDLDDEKFRFTLKRFENRGLKAHGVAATQTEEPVALGRAPFHFIIMSQFLEHVRSPRLFLEFALDRLEARCGILFDNNGPVYTHEAGGDHLRETEEAMRKTHYTEFHNASLTALNEHLSRDDLKDFYIKRATQADG